MKRFLLLVAVASAMLAAGSAARAADPYEIHALLSLTGASAFGGQAIQTNLAAVESVINKASLFNPQQPSQSLEKIPCR